MRKSSPKRDSITELFTSVAGQANTLTIPRHYIEFCNGDHLAALLLSQILYWTDRTEDPDGWFAKSYEDWYKETCLTKRQIMRLIGKDKRQKENAFSLRLIGIETAVKRSKHYEGQAAMRYRVNFEVLSKHIHAHLESKVTNAHSGKVTNGNSLEVTNAHSSEVAKGNSYITETTAKTTAESERRAALPVVNAIDAPILLPEMLATKHTPLREPQAKRSENPPTPIAAAPLPQHYRDMEARNNSSGYHPLIEAWRAGYPTSAPPSPAASDTALAVQAAKDGYTAEQVTALTREKLAAGKTMVKFGWIIQDLADYVLRQSKAAKPAIQFPTYVPLPQAAPLTKAELDALKAEVMNESAS